MSIWWCRIRPARWRWIIWCATGLDDARIVNISRRLGNQIAASIPTALDIARREGRLPEGARLLLLGTSAGVSFGGMALVA